MTTDTCLLQSIKPQTCTATLLVDFVVWQAIGKYQQKSKLKTLEAISSQTDYNEILQIISHELACAL